MILGCFSWFWRCCGWLSVHCFTGVLAQVYECNRDDWI